MHPPRAHNQAHGAASARGDFGVQTRVYMRGQVRLRTPRVSMTSLTRAFWEHGKRRSHAHIGYDDGSCDVGTFPIGD